MAYVSKKDAKNILESNNIAFDSDLSRTELIELIEITLGDAEDALEALEAGESQETGQNLEEVEKESPESDETQEDDSSSSTLNKFGFLPGQKLSYSDLMKIKRMKNEKSK